MKDSELILDLYRRLRERQERFEDAITRVLARESQGGGVDLPEMIRLTPLSEKLGIPRETLMGAIKDGRLPAKKMLGRIYVKKTHANTWVEEEMTDWQGRVRSQYPSVARRARRRRTNTRGSGKKGS